VDLIEVKVLKMKELALSKDLIKKVHKAAGCKSPKASVKEALEEWLAQQPRDWSDHSPTTSPFIDVRQSPIHGTGIYAAMDIPKGTKIIEYVGEKLTKKQADKRWEEHCALVEQDKSLGGVYLFQLNKKYDIDGHVPWNTARFINHSCDPNCETDIAKGHIWISSIRDIKKGEELFYNYGYGWEEFEDHPCLCGSYRCVGYILNEDMWPKLFKWLRKTSKPFKKR